MNTTLASPSRIMLLLVGSLGLGLLFAWSRQTVRHGEHPSTAAHTSEVHAPAAQASPESTADVIEYPRAEWPAAGIRVEAVTLGPLREAIELTGKIALNEDRLAHVFPLVEGRVDEVKVSFGQQVKRGELLVVVQSKEVGQGMLQLFQDRLNLEFSLVKNRWVQDVGRNAQAMIADMRSGATIESLEKSFADRPLGDYREKLMTAYVNHLKAKAHLDRLAPLSPSGAIPTRQILEAQSELDAARATLLSLWEQISQNIQQDSRLSEQAVKELQTRTAISETNLKILGIEDSELEHIDPATHGERLAHYPVTAPFDGTVISKDVVLLERVGPDRQILTIADLSTVWVTADIYESHLPLLSQLSGQTISLRCTAWPDREFSARIFYTGDVVQETSRTIPLRAAAENPEGLLKPGMFVSVVLPPLQQRDVIRVPQAALQNHEGRSFVFVQTGDDEFAPRDVIVGRRDPEFLEIVSGLQSGDRVAVEGGFALKSKLLAELLAE